MSGLSILRIFFALVLSMGLAWGISIREDREADPEIRPKKTRYTPFLPVLLLPLTIGLYAMSFWYQYGLTIMLENMAALCFTILLQLSVYTALLMALLPVLRRRLRPSACAILWMIPNYLYLCTNLLFERMYRG